MGRLTPGSAYGPQDEAGVRRMIEDIRSEARYAADYTGGESIDPRVLDALAAVPRHRFVPEYLRDEAYANRPLPIGHRQTISQPYIVALMTHLLGVGPGDSVLEIGTGCGYQTAVLATLVKTVYTIEVIEPLGRAAAERLRSLGFDNIEYRIGDGYAGWPERAPFDGILVTAAAPDIPPPLVEQLRPGRRLVIPVGEAGAQELKVVTRGETGIGEVRNLLPVAFVPMQRAG